MENFWNDAERGILKHMEKSLSVTLCAPHILRGLAWNALQVFTIDKSPAKCLSLRKYRRSPSLYIER